jgi:hypothetical protein
MRKGRWPLPRSVPDCIGLLPGTQGHSKTRPIPHRRDLAVLLGDIPGRALKPRKTQGMHGDDSTARSGHHTARNQSISCGITEPHTLTCGSLASTDEPPKATSGHSTLKRGDCGCRIRGASAIGKIELPDGKGTALPNREEGTPGPAEARERRDEVGLFSNRRDGSPILNESMALRISHQGVRIAYECLRH